MVPQQDKESDSEQDDKPEVTEGNDLGGDDSSTDYSFLDEFLQGLKPEELDYVDQKIDEMKGVQDAPPSSMGSGPDINNGDAINKGNY